MGFTCINAIEIAGGSAEERRKAAELLLAADYADEETATMRDGGDSLELRYETEDGLPEDELPPLAMQFPDLSLSLAYLSLDGEFYGYARAGRGGESAESEDFDEGTREALGRRHDGDVIAFVRERYGLPLRAG
jgi:hypothetical protein